MSAHAFSGCHQHTQQQVLQLTVAACKSACNFCNAKRFHAFSCQGLWPAEVVIPSCVNRVSYNGVNASGLAALLYRESAEAAAAKDAFSGLPHLIDVQLDLLHLIVCFGLVLYLFHCVGTITWTILHLSQGPASMPCHIPCACVPTHHISLFPLVSVLQPCSDCCGATGCQCERCLGGLRIVFRAACGGPGRFGGEVSKQVGSSAVRYRGRQHTVIFILIKDPGAGRGQVVLVKGSWEQSDVCFCRRWWDCSNHAHLFFHQCRDKWVQRVLRNHCLTCSSSGQGLLSWQQPYITP